MAEPFTIYKITILYMLEKSSIPLSNTQITNFFLDLDYTDYFSVQESIGNLISSSLIFSEVLHSTTMYQLTKEGQETLNYFRSKLSDGIQEDVRNYFKKNQWDFRKDNSAAAKYIELNATEYQTTCQLRSNGKILVELKLNVCSRDQAEAVCSNWKAHSDEMYEYLMDQLIQ